MAAFTVSVPQLNMKIPAGEGENLFQLLRDYEIYIDGPCAGRGTCGVCVVICNGKEVLACQTNVTEDMTVRLP